MGRDYIRASPVATEFTMCVKLTHNIHIRKSGVPAMSANITNKSSQINLRTSADTKAMIERAAALIGSTLSGFMLQSACEAARRVVSDYARSCSPSATLRHSPRLWKSRPNQELHCANSWRVDNSGCHLTARKQHNCNGINWQHRNSE